MVLIEFEIDKDDVYWMQSDPMLDAGTKDGHKEEVKKMKKFMIDRLK